MGRPSRENKVKVQVSLDKEVLSKIDVFCGMHYMSRSGFLAMTAMQYIHSAETVQLLKQMNSLLSRIADSSSVDDSVRADLDNLSRLVTLFSSGSALRS